MTVMLEVTVQVNLTQNYGYRGMYTIKDCEVSKIDNGLRPYPLEDMASVQAGLNGGQFCIGGSIPRRYLLISNGIPVSSDTALRDS